MSDGAIYSTGVDGVHAAAVTVKLLLSGHFSVLVFGLSGFQHARVFSPLSVLYGAHGYALPA